MMYNGKNDVTNTNIQKDKIKHFGYTTKTFAEILPLSMIFIFFPYFYINKNKELVVLRCNIIRQF